MKITKVYAREVLDIWKNETGYFNGSISSAQMETVLQLKGFSLAETEVIVMSLILAGAKFAD